MRQLKLTRMVVVVVVVVVVVGTGGNMHVRYLGLRRRVVVRKDADPRQVAQGLAD